jgi:hypothetical protein
MSKNSILGTVEGLYIEYQSVCPFVGIEFPLPPPPQASVSPPWTQREGEQHSLADEEVGGPNSDNWTESLALCMLCAGTVYSILCLEIVGGRLC